MPEGEPKGGFSLDDYLLSKKTILEIVDEYRKIHRLSVREKVFLFLDEIAHHPDFEQQLKNIHDCQDAKIHASSSCRSILEDLRRLSAGYPPAAGV